ncbi:MAG TPA: GNAT family N-acetyltransferase [Usitatibacter sp.]|nr:GNAT family N-acetyltransferase [Usitatibacter sp.]
MPSSETLERFIARVESNAHAEAIEEFYAPQASMQENDLEPRRGRDLLAAREREVLARMRSVRSRCVRPVFVDGDLTVIRWVFEFEAKDGGRIRMEELAYQRWDGDSIAEERFFYDPRQLAPALFIAGPFRATQLGEDDLARLQAFFDANPEYDLAVYGTPPAPSKARDEFDEEIPSGFSYERQWMLKFTRTDGTLVGMASVVSNMMAEAVWHVGLFIVATHLHGTGASREIYAALEAWMRERGARWLRLGVVVGNKRAERFWEGFGYVEVRRRLSLEMGQRVNDLRVMAKPLAGGAIAEYLAMVARDRPESP